MNILTNQNVINLIRKSLNLIDERLIHHGERVSYILLKMLEYKGGYLKKELLSYSITALFHDIGAYKNEEIDNMIQFETSDVFGHSIYGYLFLKEFSPLKEFSEIVLYHHLDNKKLSTLNIRYKSIVEYLHLADRIDISLMNSDTIDVSNYLKTYQYSKFSKDALMLFSKAQEAYKIIENIKNDHYLLELDEFFGQTTFTSDEIDQFLIMLICSIDFRSEFTVMHTITTVCVADEIGKRLKLNDQELQSLHYGALLHDIGKITTPIKILEAPRKLTDIEMKEMRNHVVMSEYILKDYIDKEILNIAVRHHERLDGSGYPKRLDQTQLSMPQRILAIADMISALCGKRSYKDEFDANKVLDILLKDTKAGKLCNVVMECVIDHYDDIMNDMHQKTMSQLNTYKSLKQQYQNIFNRFLESDYTLGTY
jgi:putative nucleotidyltransferase with HDIG domain